MDIRYLPSYGVSEVASYLRLPQSTLRDWLGRRANFKPLIAPARDERPVSLSFINLVEAYVLASIRRQHGLSMVMVRRGLEFVSRKYPSDNPLAEKTFETDGLSLFLREACITYDISRGEGQLVFEIVRKYLKRIERDPKGYPVKLYPFSGRGGPDEPRLILIDPKISFGRPILSEIYVPVESIIERYRGGESISELAEDYECEPQKIEESLRYQPLWSAA